MLKSVFVIICLFFCCTANAQNADSTLKRSPLKTISDKQYTELLNGEYDYDNIALVAELNHLPMPGKALKFKKEIDLSPVQLTKITKIATELHRKRVEMGNFIITNETSLYNLLRKGAGNSSVIFYGNRSGLYYGELRNAILQACMSTGDLLAPQQIKKLETLQKRN